MLLVACSVTQVAAQSNHSLEWGVEVGEQFTYALQRAYFSDPVQRSAMEVSFPWLQYINAGQKAILSVTQLDPIPETIESQYDLPVSRCSLFRENDSVQIGSSLASMLVPIGDWEFLAEITNITGLGLDLIDTTTQWGTVGRASYQAPGGNLVNAYIEIRYEKTNGTLSYLRYHYTSLGSDLIDVIFVHWYPGMPTLVGGDIQIVTILIIAVGGVIGIIVAFASYRYFKGKKSIAQRLGE
jgi:hypothetical protein